MNLYSLIRAALAVLALGANTSFAQTRGSASGGRGASGASAGASAPGQGPALSLGAARGAPLSGDTMSGLAELRIREWLAQQEQDRSAKQEQLLESIPSDLLYVARPDLFQGDRFRQTLTDADLARLEAFRAEIEALASTNASLAARIEEIRKATRTVLALSATQVAKSMDKIRKELGVSASEDSAVETAPKARSGGKLKGAATGLALFAAALGFSAAPNNADAQALARLAPAPAAAVYQVERGASHLIQVAAQVHADYIVADTIEDGIASWTPETPVILVGKLNSSNEFVLREGVKLTASDLRKLTEYLKGKHLVVILDNTTSSDSRIKRQIDGPLANNPAFLGWTHSQTGDRDGRAIVIASKTEPPLLHYLAEKTFGDHQLGGRAFRGDLDRFLLPKLKQGQIVEAVKSLAEGIDTRLQRSLTAQLGTVTSNVASAKSRVSAFESAMGRVSGSALQGHNLAQMKASVAAAEAALQGKRYNEASRFAAQAQSAADAALVTIASLERQAAAAAQTVARAEEAVADLGAKAERFRRSYSGLSGDIGRPEAVRDLKAQAAQARAALQSGAMNDAANAASRVLSAAQAASVAMDGYPAGAGQLDALTVRLKNVSEHGYASSARTELLDATQALADAKSAYAKGNSQWQTSVSAAEQAIKSAERVVSDAKAAADAAWAAFWGSVLIGFLLVTGLGIFMNLRTRKIRIAARKELATWREALNQELEKMYGELEEGMKLWVTSRPFAGETKALAEKAVQTHDALRTIWQKATETLSEAEALAQPARFSPRWFWNGFFPGNFRKAEAKLTQPLDVKITDGLDEILGVERVSKLKELLGKGKIADAQPTFKTMMALFDQSSDFVRQTTAAIKDATQTAGPKMDEAAAQIAAATTKKAALEAAGAEDGLFLIPTAFGSLLPAAEKALAKARKTLESDPIGTLSKSGSDAARMAQDAAKLSDLVLASREGALKDTSASSSALAQAGVGTAWIDKELRRLSGRAEALAEKATEEPLVSHKADGSLKTDKVAELATQIATLKERTAKALAMDQTWQKLTRPRIEGLVAAAAAARQELGQALGLDPKTILTEKDSDPSVALESAIAKVKEAKAFLGQGELEAAERADAEALQLAKNAAAMIDATRAAFAAQTATVAERRAKSEQLTGMIPAAELALERIGKTYAKSVLALTAGDATHPKADGTISNNIEETQKHLETAGQRIEKAVKVFEAGRILEAAALLNSALANQELAEHRLAEITEKEARLTAAVAANASAVDRLEKDVKGYVQTIQKNRVTTKPTLKAFEEAVAELKEARELVDQAKGDPFKAEAVLAAAAAGLSNVANVLARNDNDIYQEAVRSLSAAEQQYEAAVRIGQQAHGDNVPDSPEIRQALGQLQTVYKDLGEVGQTIRKGEHEDWLALDKKVDALAAAAARIAAVIKGEMQQADQAVNAISRASHEVAQASSWRGSYGTYVSGSPGANSLETARRRLQEGDYEGAASYAEKARRAAAEAIAEAEAIEARKRAEEERRRREEEERRRRREEEEAARRRRASDDSYSSGSSSSWSSGSGSSSGSSSWSSGSTSSSGSSSW